MAQPQRMVLYRCESPLHAGSDKGTGSIDLPIQRESHTFHPKIESSSIKGALREALETLSKNNGSQPSCSGIDVAFGPESGADSQGALGFGDVRILLYPVRSMKGVFAWITCPFVLWRFVNEINKANQGAAAIVINGLSDEIASGKVQCGNNLAHNQTVIFEEYSFSQVEGDITISGKNLNEWLAELIYPDDGFSYFKELLKKQLAIVSDDTFTDFVRLSTPVVPGIRIDNTTGTVARQALFYREYLPEFSVLYHVVTANPEFGAKNNSPHTAKQVMETFKLLPQYVQAGGNASIGKGWVRALNEDMEDIILSLIV